MTANEIADAVNDSSIADKQDPIILDVLHIEETVWYVTSRSDGEERGTRPIIANDIFEVIATKLSCAPNGTQAYKINIYALNLDYLQVPNDEPEDNMTTVYMKGNTEFVETRYVKTNSEEVGTETHVEITVFDIGSNEQGKVTKIIWKPFLDKEAKKMQRVCDWSDAEGLFRELPNRIPPVNQSD